jgi:hypothetical protein
VSIADRVLYANEDIALWKAVVIENSDHIYKNIIDAISPERELKQSLSPEPVFMCGADTDGHVLGATIGLLDAGIHVKILADYCASTGGVEMHKHGLAVLRRSLGHENVIGGVC